jgi:tetratricopeptide (TPR) repeat protein
VATFVNEAQQRLRRGDFPGAADFAQMVLSADPRRAEAWVVLCAALMRMGSLDDDRALADALKALPSSDPAHTLLAVERCRVLANRGRYNEAVDLAGRTLQRAALAPRQHDVLANTFTACGLYERALHHADIAVAAMPRDPATTYNHALALRHLGRIDEAVDAFESLLRMFPDHALGYFSLSACRRWDEGSNHIEAIQAALRATRIEDVDRARLHYALFKEAHDVGDRPLAWSALKAGADLVQRTSPFPHEERTVYTRSIIRRFSGGLDAKPVDTDGPIPIFIVGLPRSGTTLVERIFSAHPDVTDMGETHGLALAIRDALGLARYGELDPASVEKMQDANWPEVARLYLESLAYRAPKTRFFTEKLPHNYHLVGAIRRAFPEARIVHLRRAPMDSLFGAYKVLFGEGSYIWSYRFEDLSAAYGMYRQLTDHWRQVLGGNLVEITLEKLIADSDAEIRRLLDAIGLPFHEACLSPHTAAGGVSTASTTQVRQPINSQGVGAWRAYREQMEPLRQMLEDAGFVDAAGDPIW